MKKIFTKSNSSGRLKPQWKTKKSESRQYGQTTAHASTTQEETPIALAIMILGRSPHMI